MLADPAGEDEHVQAAQRRRHGTNQPPPAMDVNLDSRGGAPLSTVGRGQHLAHVGRDPGDPEQAGFPVERLLNVGGRQTASALYPEKPARAPPDPTWQSPPRSSSTLRSTIPAARRLAQAWLEPWKP